MQICVQVVKYHIFMRSLHVFIRFAQQFRHGSTTRLAQVIGAQKEITLQIFFRRNGIIDYCKRSDTLTGQNISYHKMMYVIKADLLKKIDIAVEFIYNK